MCGGGSDKGPEEMESRFASSEQALKFLKQYEQTFMELENDYIADTYQQFSDTNYANAAAQGANRASAIYQPAIRDQASAAFQRGFDPTSGAFQGESSALLQAQARGMGQAAADGGIGNTDMGFARYQNVVKMGQGQQTDAYQGSMDLAAAASGRIQDQAKSDFSDVNSLQSAAGSVTGMAAGFGLNSQYQNNAYRTA